MNLKENKTISISAWYKKLKASKDPIVEWIDTEQNFIKAFVSRINMLFETNLSANKNRAITSYDVNEEQAYEILEKTHNDRKEKINNLQNELKKYEKAIYEILTQNKGNKDFDIFMKLIKKDDNEKTEYEKRLENHLINSNLAIKTINKKYIKGKRINKMIVSLDKEQQDFDCSFGDMRVYDKLTDTDIKFIRFLLTKISKSDSEKGNMFYKFKKFGYEILSKEDREKLIKYIETADIIMKLNIDDFLIQKCIYKLRNPLKYQLLLYLYEIFFSMDELEDNLTEKEFNDLMKKMIESLTPCVDMFKEEAEKYGVTSYNEQELSVELGLSEEVIANLRANRK